MNIKKTVQSKEFKTLLARLYGFGASVVIMGALFKIQHWKGAGFMLAAGLITEAIIFIFYAFDTADDTSTDSQVQEKTNENGSDEISSSYNSGSFALAKFDEMLEKADITPNLLQKLGIGIKKLGDSTANMNSMGDVSAASSKYMNTIQTADESLGKLAKSYNSTIIKVINKTEYNYKNISESLSIIESGVKSYQQQLETLNKNLSSLNAVYIMQKKGAEDYLKDMTESAGENKKYGDQIKRLNENLSALNNVYGNMLAAMNVKK